MSTLSWRALASGPGWSVSDIVCTAGPEDQPFEERHQRFSIAAVSEGSFRYRSAQGTALLGPGSLLLGNAGTCFECGHEHGKGDRCLSFQFEADWVEETVSAIPGARRLAFPAPCLPPLPELTPTLAAAEAARERADSAAFEEIALELVAKVFGVLAGSRGTSLGPSSRDARRITAALRRIEACSDERLTLAALAREAAMSPYHFLRSFRQIVGMTPHQYVLRLRLHRAAVRLRATDAPVSRIAFEAGFEDLSTFNRRFRRVMGANPSAYRTTRTRR